MQETPTEEITDLVEADEAQRKDAAERARSCAIQVEEVLARHNCRILPRIDPSMVEPVGLAGDRVQITATYWIAPMANS